MIKTPKKSLIDHAYITVRSGNGGDGAVSFRREKFVPRGGPDGGSGGKGGSVFIKATSSLNTLSNFIYRKHFFAKNGENGGSRNKAGRDAEDIEILVPVGTTVIDRDSGLLIKDLDKDGESAIVAKGGKGGKGNKSFATSRDQAPRYSEKGEPGEEKQLELVLKILSDVGVIGAPNAGKSTLLSQVSNAKPTIANYPFTTLSPKIGTVKLEDGSSFVIADLPGLIEGASAGKGMGVEFLSHVERTKLLLLLIDGSDRKAIRATYEMLLSELEAFKSELLYKPRVVVINKIDTWKVKRTKEIENFFEDRGERVFFISAKNRIGLGSLIQSLNQILKSMRVSKEPVNEEKVYSIDRKERKERKLIIEKVDENTFKVTNKELERYVELADFKRSESLHSLWQYFNKIELEKELLKSGIKDGDRVVIGEKSFTFRKDE
ncbi:MAG: GTPase ObgE [Caldisericaceae bacterium]